MQVAAISPTEVLRQAASTTEGSHGNASTPLKAPLAPAVVVNPALSFDQASGLVIVQFRDPDTGEVERQYPSAKVVQEYQVRAREGVPQADAAPELPPALAAQPNQAVPPAPPAVTESAATTKSAAPTEA